MTGFTGAFPTHLKALKVTTTEAGEARAAPLGGVPKVCPSSASSFCLTLTIPVMPNVIFSLEVNKAMLWFKVAFAWDHSCKNFILNKRERPTLKLQISVALARRK